MEHITGSWKAQVPDSLDRRGAPAAHGTSALWPLASLPIELLGDGSYADPGRDFHGFSRTNGLWKANFEPFRGISMPRRSLWVVGCVISTSPARSGAFEGTSQRAEVRSAFGEVLAAAEALL